MSYRNFSLMLWLVAFNLLTGIAFAQTDVDLGATTQESVIYNFKGGTDGSQPRGGLLLRNGVLYGTTSFGGNNNVDGGTGCGVVFKMTKTGLPTVIYTFQDPGESDGCAPESDLVMDSLGNLYGTTVAGGSVDEGVVFE